MLVLVIGTFSFAFRSSFRGSLISELNVFFSMVARQKTED
jgi:hypothetical protein